MYSIKLPKYIILFVLIFSASILHAQENTDQLIASHFYQQGEFDKASELYAKLYKETSSHFFYDAYLKCLIALNDYSKAEKLVKEQSKKHPENLSYLVDLGFIYNKSGNIKGAEKQYQKAIDMLSPNPNSIFELASAFINKNEQKQAINTYLKGRQLIRNDLVFVYELADLYHESGMLIEMLGEYLTLLYFDPGQLEEIQNSLQNKLTKKNEFAVLQQELLKIIQKSPEKPIFSELLIWHYVQLKDFNSAIIQCKSLDRRYKEDGYRLLQIAELCVANNEFEAAVKAVQYVIEKGTLSVNYMIAHRALLTIKKKKIEISYNPAMEELTMLDSDYDNFIKEFGESSNTATVLRDKAILKAYYFAEYDSAIHLFEYILTLSKLNPLFAGQCKLDLGDIYVIKGSEWDATLYYSQVDKSFKDDPLAHEARYRNARLSFFTGDFEWAKAQLDILKSATSELIANNAVNLSVLIMDNLNLDTTDIPLKMYAKADLFSFQNKDNDAVLLLDSISTLFPKHNLMDEILFKKAGIFEKRGDLKTSEELYKKIIEKYPDDILGDDAFFALAKLYEEKMNEKEKAMELYQKILTDYQGSLYIAEARKRFRVLRGDYVN